MWIIICIDLLIYWFIDLLIYWFIDYIYARKVFLFVLQFFNYNLFRGKFVLNFVVVNEPVCKLGFQFWCHKTQTKLERFWLAQWWWLSIVMNYRCDGEEDCEPGIDEENCDEDAISRARNNGSQSCGPHQMSCASKSGCISMTWVCDGEADCDDGSDESNCPMWCGKDQFTCSENVCIGFFHVCNGEKVLNRLF